MYYAGDPAACPSKHFFFLNIAYILSPPYSHVLFLSQINLAY